MAISRNGHTPPYYEYGTKFVIVKDKNSTKQQLDPSVSVTDPHMVYIPAYQRKLVWKKDDIKELVNTKSNLYGTVILATWSTDPESPMTLVDGLQRLGVITAFLYHLYPLVLSQSPSDQTNAPFFNRLSINAERYHPVYEQNQEILLNHYRIGIRESYKELSDTIQSFIEDELHSAPQEFAEKIIASFMDRYIAIDPYYGFKTDKELTDTFLNINSTGVALTEVDLLRSQILSQVYSLGWPEQETLDFENDFTEVFQPQKGGNKSGMKVLGGNLYSVIQEDRATKIHPNPKEFLFKTWDKLDKKETESLLDYLNDAINAGDERLANKTRMWKELSEIYRCGDLPFAIAVWYFYKEYYQKGKVPDFVGGTESTTNDCRLLLRACYRRVIDGTVGQMTSVLQDIISEKINTVNEIAEAINPESTAGKINVDPSDLWLKQSLRTIDPTKAKRVFNACLLPNRGSTNKFEPMVFENKPRAWNIDHLIPKSHKIKNKEGEKQINQLVNLAPLHYDLNHLAKTTPCKIKLESTGLYSQAKKDHEYLEWLCDQHYPSISGNKDELNNQDCLTLDASNPIGSSRIEKISEILSKKI